MKVNTYGNITGRAGTTRTVREMQRLVKEGRVDPTIIFTAEQIARNHGPKDYRAQANGVFQFVKKFIHYVKDPRNTELLRSPFWTLYYRAGDCDDQAMLVCALAEAMGFNSRFKTIKADGRFPNEFTHIYPQIEIPGEGWTSADTIVPESYLGWEPDERFGSYVWSRDLGGATMMGFGADTPQPISLNDPVSSSATAKPSTWQNILGVLGNGLVSATQVAVTSAVNNYAQAEGLKPKPSAVAAAAAAAPSGGLPSWLLPAGVVGAALVGVVLIKLRKRR